MSILICMLKLSFLKSLFLVTEIRYFCSKTQFSLKERERDLANLPVIYLVHFIYSTKIEVL